MNLLKKIFLLSLSSIFMFTAFGCNSKGFEKDNTPIEWGFSVNGSSGNNGGDSDPSEGSGCAYKTDRTVFDIDCVYVEFFYGHEKLFGPPKKYEINAAVWVILGDQWYMGDHVFKEGDSDVVLIRTVDDYGTNSDAYLYDNLKPQRFSHSETVHIPKSVFNSDNGIIRLAFSYWFTVPVFFGEETEITTGYTIKGAVIKYQVKGKTVRLTVDEEYYLRQNDV